MAWLLVNPEMHSIFASLGILQGDSYQVSDDCLSNLKKILDNLTNEDRTLRTFRRAIGFGQNIKKDLLPLLIHVKNEDAIINATIRILVNLTIPVECLLSTDAMSRTDIGRHTVFELNRLLLTSKDAFCDARATKAILDHIKQITDRNQTMNVDQCDNINNCLLLLRNVLHIPTTGEMAAEMNSESSAQQLVTALDSSLQNQIIWNLFTQSIDKIILHLIAHKQTFDKSGPVAYWGVTIVQLIALLYKDQHVGTLHKLLNLWCEMSLSDSSDDNESNTSPQPDQESGDSSPMLTSDPTSDSSDNGGGSNKSERILTEIKQNINTKTTTIYVANGRPSKSTTISSLETLSNDGSVSASISVEIGGGNLSTNTSVRSKISVASSSTSASSSNNAPGIFRPKGITACMKNISQRLEKSNEVSNTTSDISATNKQSNVKFNNNHQKSLECPSEISDCGYGTQMEKETISTSSNDDDTPHAKPVHQKPSHAGQKNRFKEKSRTTNTVQDKKELRRKKLVKRSKTHIINMKGLIHHTPTNEDISNILKEFTVDFLLKGYNFLVNDIYTQLLTDLHVQIDTSHFFWLVTYFLKFATQLELDLEHVHSVLSFDIVRYLTYEGVDLWEQLEIASKQMDRDLKPFLRRMHLAVTAVREFLQTLDVYKKMSHLSQEDKNYVENLRQQLAALQQLKCLFVLLIRQYNPKIQTIQYLQDLIVTNHQLMLFLDSVQSEKNKFTVSEHIEKFATVEVMHQYGLLLENFQDNGEYVNNCVFTMMHHVCGDIKSVSTLFQPIILKTFSQIWETDYDICDDWSDMIEYVIHKFISTPRQNLVPTYDFNYSMDDPPVIQNNLNQSQLDVIFPEHNQIVKPQEIMEVSNSSAANDEICKRSENLDLICDGGDEPKPWETKEFVFSNEKDGNTMELNLFKDLLLKQQYHVYINAVQKLLIETCCIKLQLRYKDFKPKIEESIREPVPYFYCIFNKSIPIVTWSANETQIYQLPSFIMLMQKLGFILPSETGNIFVRIPALWTAEKLFTTALKLGPIDIAKINFDMKYLQNTKSLEQVQTSNNRVSPETKLDEKQMLTMDKYSPMQTISMLPFNSRPPTNWLHTVTKANANSPATPSKTAISIEIPTSIVPMVDKPPLISIATNGEQHCSPGEEQEEGDEDRMSCKVMCSPTIKEHSSPVAPMEQELSDVSETYSVASDLTRMCVSDEDENSERFLDAHSFEVAKIDSTFLALNNN